MEPSDNAVLSKDEGTSYQECGFVVIRNNKVLQQVLSNDSLKSRLLSLVNTRVSEVAAAEAAKHAAEAFFMNSKHLAPCMEHMPFTLRDDATATLKAFGAKPEGINGFELTTQAVLVAVEAAEAAVQEASATAFRKRLRAFICELLPIVDEVSVSESDSSSNECKGSERALDHLCNAAFAALRVWQSVDAKFLDIDSAGWKDYEPGKVRVGVDTETSRWFEKKGLNTNYKTYELHIFRRINGSVEFSLSFPHWAHQKYLGREETPLDVAFGDSDVQLKEVMELAADLQWKLKRALRGCQNFCDAYRSVRRNPAATSRTTSELPRLVKAPADGLFDLRVGSILVTPPGAPPQPFHLDEFPGDKDVLVIYLGETPTVPTQVLDMRDTWGLGDHAKSAKDLDVPFGDPRDGGLQGLKAFGNFVKSLKPELFLDAQDKLDDAWSSAQTLRTTSGQQGHEVECLRPVQYADATLFRSGCVHRGPGNQKNEHRIALFCYLTPPGREPYDPGEQYQVHHALCVAAGTKSSAENVLSRFLGDSQWATAGLEKAQRALFGSGDARDEYEGMVKALGSKGAAQTEANKEANTWDPNGKFWDRLQESAQHWLFVPRYIDVRHPEAAESDASQSSAARGTQAAPIHVRP